MWLGGGGQLRGKVLGMSQGVPGTDFSVAGRQFWRVHVDFACCRWLVVLFTVQAVKKSISRRQSVWALKKR